MAISKINSKALVDCSVAAVDIEDGSITSAKLAGSIANAKLANSSITVNGNTVSLGASGAIPPVSWQSVVTADGSTTTTAVSGNGYFIDTTSAAHTITLPASPSAGDYVAIKDYAGTFGTNSLTIGRNSENIQGVANDSLISTNRASVVLVYIDSTKGWLYTVESNVADLQSTYITATGGTVTTSGDFKIHTFTGDGCFVVSSVGNSPNSGTKVDYLVVAGGGGGGGRRGAGAGAGGYRESKDSTLNSPHTTSPVSATTGLTISATTYPVTVGAGGAGGCGLGGVPNDPDAGSPGSNSVFSTITSTGGGGGGGDGQNSGSSGGSGGGGSSNPGGSGNTPPTSPSQGNNGGNGTTGGPPNYGGGGGGGIGSAGTDGAPTTGGNGGNGVATSINGSSVTRAGGGGSGTYQGGTEGSGGTGGGGAGGTGGTCNPGVAGTANTGGGGGGGSIGPADSTGRDGGAGGKGIVIIRYKYQ